jgi:hypothetical protein
MTNREFKELLKKAPDPKHYIVMKYEIIEQCNITKEIWRNWLQGRTPIKERYTSKIIAIIKQYSCLYKKK